MFCKECGKSISDDSKFCSYCGSRVEAPNKLETIEKLDSLQRCEITIFFHNPTHLKYFVAVGFCNIPVDLLR